VEDDQPRDDRSSADPRDADLLQSFARLGVGPGLDIDALDASTKRGLARAAVDGRTSSTAPSPAATGKERQRLELPPPETGRMTPTRDWLLRALQPAAGFNANDPIEAVYLNVSVDGTARSCRGPIATSCIRQGRRAKGQGVLVANDVQFKV